MASVWVESMLAARTGGVRVGRDAPPVSWEELGARARKRATMLRTMHATGTRVAVPLGVEAGVVDALVEVFAGLDADLCVLPVNAALPQGAHRSLVERAHLDARTHDNARLLLPTSGSTGEPLLAVLSERALESNARAIASSLSLTGGDVTLCVPPPAYAYGFSTLTSHVLAGATVVLEPRAAFPADLLDTATGTGCTLISAVPTTWQLLLRRGLLASARPSSLRLATSAGGPLASSLIPSLREALGPAQLAVMYGQTEACARLSCTAPGDLDAAPSSVGRAIPGVTLEIAPDGEVLATGPNLMDGYLDDPARTAATLKDGWLHTGDLGTMDSEGRLTLVGRRKLMLKVGGARVAPGVVESALLSAPGVEAAAVVGAPDDLLGEVPVAFITGDATQDAALLHVTPLLAPHERPRRIIRVDALPRLPGGKPDLLALAAMARGSS